MELFTGAGTPAFAIGALLGVSFLIGGLVFGIWIGRRSGPLRDAGRLDDYHLANLLGGLFKWTDGFAAEVSRYREFVDSVSERFSAVSGQQGATENQQVVMTMLKQIAAANDRLQQRLDKAECALKDQAQEIAGYMSEARTDMLTGLPNRRVFDDELNRRMAEWRRYGTPVSVVIIDIDFFKKFNDTYGHLAGDAVLRQVAQVLRDTMRESDLVVRLGGEEFAAVLPGSEGANVWLAAERARQQVNDAPFHYEGQHLSVSISCGAAQAIANDTLASLVRRADEALYASKAAGRNCAHWHDGREMTPITPGFPGEGSESEPFETDEEMRERFLATMGEQSPQETLAS